MTHKIKGPLDREDDFNGGPGVILYQSPPLRTEWPRATETKPFLDSIRDLLATAEKVCFERESGVSGERSADLEVERLQGIIRGMNLAKRRMNEAYDAYCAEGDEDVCSHALKQAMDDFGECDR